MKLSCGLQSSVSTLVLLFTSCSSAAWVCTDTRGWANDCVRDGCSMSQFPYGHTPGYFNASGPDPGWTCAMYADNRTRWCSDGQLIAKAAGGAKYNFPERNCCECGKGKPQPPSPPPPPPPPPSPPLPPFPPVWLCGGACQSGMVLQRNGSRLWGISGDNGEKFVVMVDDVVVGSSMAGSDGKWAVDFVIDTRWNATIVVNSSTGKSVTLDNVGFGEVLLCSGQSNMELVVPGPLTPAMETGIRVMRPDHWSSPNISRDTVTWHHSWDGTGTACTDRCGGPWGPLGDNPQFSAVCKFTATSLFQAWNGTVPIGLVESAWGGTRIESWSSSDALSQCPDDTTAGCGPPIGGSSQMGRMNSTNSGNLCSAAYNGMLHPLLPMRFKAMLWYQGESNLDPFEGQWAGARNYACRARAAVMDWRAKFGQLDLPFFFVELAACNGYDDAQVTFPLLRQASRSILSLPHTGFITAIDLGNGGDVHSPVKIPDGERLALQLRAKVYGEDVIADGPVLAHAPVVVDSGHVVLTFNGTAGLHVAPVSHATSGCAQSPFEVGFSNGSWARVPYVVNATSATVTLLPQVASARSVTEVRFAWEGYPQCALYSGVSGGWNDTSSGVLPVAPFRVAVSSGCMKGQTPCPVLGGVQCCVGFDVKPFLPGGEVCTAHGGGCQCRGCVGSNPPFPN